MLAEAILIGLAGWRLASMLVDESGPADIFEKLRTAVGVQPGEISGFLSTVFSCVYCMSVYTCLLMFGIWQLEPMIVMVIAAMTVAILAHSIGKING